MAYFLLYIRLMDSGKGLRMNFRDVRFWAMLNALLALLIIALLGLLLRGQRRQGAVSVDGAERNETAPIPLNALAERGEVDFVRVGVRPVSFTRIVIAADAAEGWRVRGVQPQEWARLPASPGMDMTEGAEGYLLTFSLPGVCNEDIRLSVTDRVVTVQAVVRDPHGTQIGGVERRVRLPPTSKDDADFKAIFTNGVLRVCVAK